MDTAQLQPAGLPPQQAFVLLDCAMGFSVKETARRLDKEITTIWHHRKALMRKTGTKNMNQAIAASFKVGYLKYVPVLIVCLVSIFGGDHQARRTSTQRPQVVTVRVRESFV